MVAAAAILAYAAFASGMQTLTWSASVAVLIPAATVLLIAVRRHRSPPQPPAPATRRALPMWIALVLAGVLWEAWAFLDQPAWDTATYDHPSLSSLAEPHLDNRTVRFTAWAAWLYAGTRLARS